MAKLPLIHENRAIKSKKEIKCILQAQKISEKVLARAVKGLSVGITELAVSHLIDKEFKKLGIKAVPFSPIVAFGKSTANIHHVPGKNKLRIGDLVMIDLGATISGYCSDMTRTYFFGNPSMKQKKVYLSVLQAQHKVLKAIQRGERRTRILDAIAHQSLERKFGAKAFPHSLGHGVGTVVHEWPFLKEGSEDILKPGMVVTIEPGVYLKGWGGIRIEDMIVITSSGYRNLTLAPKDLKSIIII